MNLKGQNEILFQRLPGWKDGSEDSQTQDLPNTSAERHEHAASVGNAVRIRLQNSVETRWWLCRPLIVLQPLRLQLPPEVG
jgi:hypothetical protein